VLREFCAHLFAGPEVAALIGRVLEVSDVVKPIVRFLNARNATLQLAYDVGGRAQTLDAMLLETYPLYFFDRQTFDGILERFKTTVAEMAILAPKVMQMSDGDSPAAEELRAWVCDRGMPWPWLTQEILQIIAMHILAATSGEPVRRQVLVPAEQKQVVHDLQVTFAFHAGEDLHEAIRRLSEGATDVERQLVGLPRGRVPDKLVPILERDARWFYSVHVARREISDVAREAFGNSYRERRKDVRDGVAEARRWLELNPWRFDPGGFVVQSNSPGGSC
jgi:hypothetical protein